jgi:hypothetical protein
MVQEKERNNNMAAAIPDMDVIETNDYKIELVWVDDDLMVHLFSDQWPDGLKKKIIKVMDATMADSYNVGYESVANSWFIRVFDFTKGRTTPRITGKLLMEDVIQKVWDLP